MSATKVRVVFEYRNGDGHFVSYHRGEFVQTNGEHDLRATDAAYIAALQAKEKKRLFLETTKASRD